MSRFRRLNFVTRLVQVGAPVWAFMLIGLHPSLSKLAGAAVIGLDEIHHNDPSESLATGSNFAQMRSIITAEGNTIVPLTSFNASDLAGLDAAFFTIHFGAAGQSDGHPYSASEISAIQAFVGSKAVFLSDTSLWGVSTGADRDLGSGNNATLLRNVLSFVGGGGGVFLADAANGFDVANFNDLVSPYGVTYASSPTDGSGRTVSGFVPHPLTQGVTQLGVDFQLPMTVTAPALDLTTGGGQDNVLAVYTPEPAAPAVLCTFVLALGAARRRPAAG